MRGKRSLIDCTLFESGSLGARQFLFLFCRARYPAVSLPVEDRRLFGRALSANIGIFFGPPCTMPKQKVAVRVVFPWVSRQLHRQLGSSSGSECWMLLMSDRGGRVGARARALARNSRSYRAAATCRVSSLAALPGPLIGSKQTSCTSLSLCTSLSKRPRPHGRPALPTHTLLLLHLPFFTLLTGSYSQSSLLSFAASLLHRCYAYHCIPLTCLSKSIKHLLGLRRIMRRIE